MAKKRIYCDISKVEDNEDGTITVTGIASSGAVDSDGETVTPEAMKNAIPDYMKFGAVREMHQPSAAGTAISCAVDETTGKTDFSALVVDAEAIKKVKTGVYKGFSIGGKVTERDATDKKIIKGLNLIEISLVDRPANPEALMTMYKAASTPEDDVADVAEMLDAGTVTPARLLELVKRHGATDPVEEPVNKNDTTAEGNGSMVVPPKGGITTGTIAAPEAGDKGNIKKGMYTVSDFAATLCSLSWLVSDAAWEAEYEGDNSPIPAKLFAWLQTGTEIFKEMAAEETAEMIAALRAAANLPEVVEMASKANLLGAGDTIAKAGAQFSAKTKAKIGEVHDALKDCCDKLDALGYKTDDDDADSAATVDMGKAATGDTNGIDQLVQDAVAKAVAPINTNLEKLGKENEELKKQLDEANAKFNAQPQRGKALLMALSKAQDASSTVSHQQTPEVVPPEGTQARAEYEMRKAVSSMGLR